MYGTRRARKSRKTATLAKLLSAYNRCTRSPHCRAAASKRVTTCAIVSPFRTQVRASVNRWR
jgi:hypothetical protein